MIWYAESKSLMMELHWYVALAPHRFFFLNQSERKEHGKNDFAERSKILLNTDLKIILLKP